VVSVVSAAAILSTAPHQLVAAPTPVTTPAASKAVALDEVHRIERDASFGS